MTPKSKILSFVSAILISVVLAGTAQAGSAPSTLADIKASGELVLGTSGSMKPMTFTTADGKVTGFDIDMARLMASGMGVKLTIKTMPFNELLGALESGDVDVVISNMTMNPERNMRVAFVGPYMKSGKCVVTRRESVAQAQEAEDLNVPETRLAALKGSTSAEFVKTLLPKATLTLVEKHEDAVEMIKDGKVGGMLADYPVCRTTLQSNPDDGFISLLSLLSYEPIGIAVPGGDALYVNWVENFLDRLDAMGLLDEMGEQWFGKDVVAQ